MIDITADWEVLDTVLSLSERNWYHWSTSKKDGCPSGELLHRPMQSFIDLVYPEYALFTRSSGLLPLSARSLIVKACQSQKFPTTPGNTLYDLFVAHPDVPVVDQYNNGFHFRSLLAFLYDFDLHLDDPLESAIVLDLMRALPVDHSMMNEEKLKSWAKELVLAEGVSRPNQIRWSAFFDESDPILPIANDLPPNPNMIRTIRRILLSFRSEVEGTVMWPRATHKNMSRDTRRRYEEHSAIRLNDVAIFGQDDWERYYAETGTELQGCCELRQVWTPNQVKPRTYAAMGGSSYSKCRHLLQDFFTLLCNLFSTNKPYKSSSPLAWILPPICNFGIYRSQIAENVQTRTSRLFRG